MKKTIDHIDVKDKRVLVRLDLNVPLDEHQNITDDRRIQAALPTVKKLLDDGGRLVLMSHLGRPKDGGPEDRRKYSLKPVARRLSELLGREVKLMDDCVGPTVASTVTAMRSGDVILLENLRFKEAETIKDKSAAKDASLREKKQGFARQLADLADVYVNDAFGTCHRDNASMLTVPQLMEGKPRVTGYLVEKELRFLGSALTDPARPFVCVLGGAKVSDKLGVIQSLLPKCESILIGGAMAYTFFKAKGFRIGKSLVEDDLVETARGLMSDGGDKLRLPEDSVVASEIAEGVETEVCTGDIPGEKMGLDIGPKTVKSFGEIISGAKTVVWNGPMGVFETPPFDAGTMGVAGSMAEATRRGAVTIIGGGDSAAAIEKAGLADRMTHVSTGGGASLEFLEGKPFAAIDVLDEA